MPAVAYIYELYVTFKASSMDENSTNAIWEERETSKMGLDTFTHNRNNILDSPIDKLIEDLKKEINAAYSEYNQWNELEEKNPVRFKELEEQANQSGHTLYSQMAGYIQEAIYLEEELFALLEMKIIYAFKHLEINIKQLLFAAYQDNYINRQFKWDSIVQFLNSKSIIAKDLNDYENINQLRNVNNSLKHSDKVIDQLIKNIPEFKDKDTLSYNDLELFYNRIKRSPNIFLTSLVSFVFKDIYTFTHERIFEIAKSFALRMDKKDSIEFSEELLKLYE
jgi:hypothetical protein